MFGLGCEVTFSCSLVQTQEVLDSGGEQYGKDCFYRCFDTARHMNVTAVGDRLHDRLIVRILSTFLSEVFNYYLA